MSQRKAEGASDRMLFDWTPEVIVQARALWDNGVSTIKIGRAIGCSKNALVGKAHRLRWPSRPSPIKGAASRKLRKPQPVGNQPTLPPLPHTTSSSVFAAQPPSMAGRSCQWIDGAPTRHAIFCNAPTQPGSSYCPTHHARCWIAPTARNTNPKIGPVPMRDGRADDRGLMSLPG